MPGFEAAVSPTNSSALKHHSFTTTEAASELGIRPSDVRALIHAGALNARKVDGWYIVSSESLSAYKRLRQGPRPAQTEGLIGRRQFLKKGLLFGVQTVIASRLAIDMQEFDQDLQERKQARLLFHDLFRGSTPPRTTAGLRKYRTSHGFHADNYAAHVALGKPLGFTKLIPEADITTHSIPFQREGDLVLFGGPISTAETMVAWQYDGPDDRHLARPRSPVLTLRWWGIADESHPQLASLTPTSYIMPEVGARKVKPWSFYDSQRPNHLWSPQGNPEEALLIDGERVPRLWSDHLLISRLPNVLDPNIGDWITNNPNTWPSLLILDGGHGIATRATELLLTASGHDAIQSAVDTLVEARYFQLLFQVSDPHVRFFGSHFDRFTRIALQDAYSLENTPRDTWREAGRFIDERLSRPLPRSAHPVESDPS